MKRAMAVWLVLLSAILLCNLRPAQAQDANKSASGNSSTPEQAEKPLHAYRIDFTISEMDNGKKLNSRRYVMDLNSGNWNRTKIGTRVPISTPQTPLQYMDVGTSIDCRVAERAEEVQLEVRSEISNFSSPNELHSTQPIVRQISITGSTLVTLGKPVVIGSVDDPNSTRQFQLEATVTKLK